MSSNFLNYRLNIRYSDDKNMFLSASYLTRLNNKVNKGSKEANDIKELTIDSVYIENIDNTCEKELLLLSLSNSRSSRYYRYINN